MLTPHQQHEARAILQALHKAEARDDTQQQIALYRQLLKLIPDMHLGHAQLANILLRMTADEEALTHIDKALAGPANEDIDRLIFDLMCDRPLFLDDVARARSWYEASPTRLRFKLYAKALIQNEVLDEAEALLARELQSPHELTQQALLLSLLGWVYYGMGRFHESIACNQLALEGTPNDVQLHLNLALTLEQVKRYPDAMRHYQRALVQEPKNADAHNNLSQLMLRLGQFEVGWQHYEWRWAKVLRDQLQNFPQPRWNGEPLHGRTLLVWAEQGMGDQIMFASMLPDLQHLDGPLLFEAAERLIPLFTRSFPGVQFFTREEVGRELRNGVPWVRYGWPACDLQTPMGSLGILLRRSRQDFTAHAGYLKADPHESVKLRNDYHLQFPGKRLIGISWRGGTSVTNFKQSRRIEMSQLAHLACLADVQLINLQYGEVEQDLEQARLHGLQIFNDRSVDPLLDIDRQASQIAALDAVISIDNTTVHLAGALGVPTLALLPMNPDWRWGLEEGQSFWYPCVQLLHNARHDDWGDIIKRCATMLAT
ncbi:tetratricopeptide repeat-containing glycosyltransferase family protein [Pseudomonas sp. GD03721]|nr:MULTISPECIES: tetratricopeptide repeat-containing glycosyltransferase family protein [unclassified Pseudomonas]MDH1443984.1 tetratricopeptide repeat-containing glycosyltransferase family protein [Pseudomonas sp. GD03722]WGG03277.1 tetratricopeptide repeat-containing glycosyltransferase family protein [Pseudomonas sp. GD03721]WGG07445.1 tetratricopeptide repeat-containing glycosyltransferase family protein [Pseudomonas sp. GD03919]